MNTVMADNANSAAVQLLYDNIHALPDDEYGHINMLPFAYDSELVREHTRRFSQAVITLLDSNGLIQHEKPKPVASKVATVKCRICAKVLLHINIGDGVGAVDAPMFIASVARMNPECPHDPVTIDDHRRHMEREFIDLVEATDAAADDE